MNDYRFSKMMVVSVLVMLVGCATSRDGSAQQEELAKRVSAALDNHQFKIDVDMMNPRMWSMRHVSYGYSVEVRNDTLISYLPYFGRAYSVPYGGGKGLNFSAPIKSYTEYEKKGKRYVRIGVSNEEDTYTYKLEVFSNGKASIDVQPRERESISYSGELNFDE